MPRTGRGLDWRPPHLLALQADALHVSHARGLGAAVKLEHGVAGGAAVEDVLRAGGPTLLEHGLGCRAVQGSRGGGVRPPKSVSVWQLGMLRQMGLEGRRCGPPMHTSYW